MACPGGGMPPGGLEGLLGGLGMGPGALENIWEHPMVTSSSFEFYVGFQKGGYPQTSSIFIGFPIIYKASIWGYHHSWKPPYEVFANVFKAVL